MKKKEWLLFFGILAADQISKLAVSSLMELGDSITIIKNFFYLTFVTNSGAAWSIFSGWPMRWVFVLLAAAVCVYVYIYMKKEQTTALMRWTLTMIMAGSVGNMIDRIVSGKVVDFLNFYIFGYDFPVFNIADCALTIGTIILVIDILFLEGRHNEKH